MTKITLRDIMHSPEYPKCERCNITPMAIAFPSTGLAKELPSYGIPAWCTGCLKNANWQEYYQLQAREEYQTGKRQS